MWNNPDQLQQDKYRHGYQGQYSEADTTTGWNAFELRMYDPLIGRWLQVDPYGEYASSYLGMGNNPVSLTDPDGGRTKPSRGFKNPSNFFQRLANWFNGHSFLNEAHDLEQAGFNVTYSPDNYGGSNAAYVSNTTMQVVAYGDQGTEVWQAVTMTELIGSYNPPEPVLMDPTVIGSTTTTVVKPFTNQVLERLRRQAVRHAWRLEKELVKRTGQGTRNWTRAEVKELLSKGKVKGYQGHHINSVKAHPNLAGNPDNIIFVSKGEHLTYHGGSWRNATTGDFISR